MVTPDDLGTKRYVVIAAVVVVVVVVLLVLLCCWWCCCACATLNVQYAMKQCDEKFVREKLMRVGYGQTI